MKNLAAETKSLLEEIESLRSALFKTEVFDNETPEAVAAE